MNNHRKFFAATGLAAVMTLTGCGGDGGNDAETPPASSTSVPDDAGANGTALVSYIQGLDPNDETSESLTIPDTFDVPADETEDPVPLT